MKVRNASSIAVETAVNEVEQGDLVAQAIELFLTERRDGRQRGWRGRRGRFGRNGVRRRNLGQTLDGAQEAEDGEGVDGARQVLGRHRGGDGKLVDPPGLGERVEHGAVGGRQREILAAMRRRRVARELLADQRGDLPVHLGLRDQLVDAEQDELRNVDLERRVRGHNLRADEELAIAPREAVEELLRQVLLEHALDGREHVLFEQHLAEADAA